MALIPTHLRLKSRQHPGRATADVRSRREVPFGDRSGPAAASLKRIFDFARAPSDTGNRCHTHIGKSQKRVEQSCFNTLSAAST